MDRVQGYDEDQIALVIPDFQICGMGPCYSGDSYDKLHHKYDKGERDRYPGDTLGKSPGGLSPGSLMGYSYNRPQGI